MRIIPTVVGLTLLAVLSAGVWVMRYRPQWIEPAAASEEGADSEEVDPQTLKVPVHVGHPTRATLHGYVQGFGVVEPSPPRAGRMAGTADVASPVAGVVAEVLCEAGQQVAKGAALIQLDDRVAQAAQRQAAAAVDEARAAQARLKSTPRPEQLEIARLAVEKAQSAVEFARRNHDRQEELARVQSTAEKNVEQAALELGSANNDLAVAKNQLVLLSPTSEELAEQAAKVAQAEAALAAAQTQSQLLRIVSPIDATVVAITANPGESVDSTKVLVDLVGLDRLVVNVGVPVEELASIKADQVAQISPAGISKGTDDVPGFEGKVYFVGSEVDQKTGTLPVGIDIAPGAVARPGQSVRVRIVTDEHKDCLAVPKESIIADENGDPVLAIVEGEQATHKHVKVGLREGNLVEVEADGIDEKTQVVTGGAYSLAKFQAAKVKVLEN